MQRAAGGRRAALAAGLAVALLACAIWPLLHPARPLLPTDDLYTHLSVARHLARGDGFLCDIAYPLSFAWPFARALPQPLVHRPPGWPVALLVPYAAVGGDTHRLPGAVRALQVLVLAIIAGLGTAAWVRRGRIGAAAAWLVPLAACPLLPYAVDWGHTELPAAALLLSVWLRYRDGLRTPGAIDGLLTGLLALLRPELAWLPPVWWLWLAHRPHADRRRTLRGAWLAMLVVLALTGPWLVRNARLAGNPFFSVQAAAEVAKDTRTWPGYEVYRQLEPQPAWHLLRDDPLPVARKTARGLRFFARELPGLVPWALPVLLLAGALAGRRSGLRRRPAAANGPEAIAPHPSWLRAPAPTALATIIALAALYAPLDHSLRHLLVMVPILAWEAAPWLGEWPWTLRRRGAVRPAWPAWRTVLAALVVAVPVVLLTQREPTGWAGAARDAVTMQAGALREAEVLRGLPADTVPFVESAAAPWLADRAAVWSPRDEATAAAIRAWLAPASGTGRQP
jgi:hypothetical protein